MTMTLYQLQEYIYCHQNTNKPVTHLVVHDLQTCEISANFRNTAPGMSAQPDIIVLEDTPRPKPAESKFNYGQFRNFDFIVVMPGRRLQIQFNSAARLHQQDNLCAILQSGNFHAIYVDNHFGQALHKVPLPAQPQVGGLSGIVFND
jgi:hypothetical protein